MHLARSLQIKMSDKTEQLIDIVKCYPVLYDTTEDNYRNNRVKNRIWDKIAEQIQEKDGDTVKTKWKNLRDSYSKHLRAMNTPSGQSVKHIERYKAWPWVKQISFLQPYLELAATSNVATKHKKVKKLFKRKHDKTLQKSSPPQSPPQQQSSSEFQDSSAQEQNTSSQHHNQRHAQSQIDKVIDYFNNRSKTDYDETDLIFLGYSKTIKKMSMRRQASIKFSIAKIIMEAEIEHAEETNPYNSIVSRDSTPFNSQAERKNASQEYYVSPSDYVADTRDFPEPAEPDGPVESRQFCYISTKAEPLAMDTSEH